tara:strand:- start:1042 stop:1833 length:792 start_codon:yes stop_codon:yes gene_type:complete
MSLLTDYLKAQGRRGDTELAHVTPEEKDLLKSLGGAGTTNPVTGLKEYYPGANRGERVEYNPSDYELAQDAFEDEYRHSELTSEQRRNRMRNWWDADKGFDYTSGIGEFKSDWEEGGLDYTTMTPEELELRIRQAVAYDADFMKLKNWKSKYGTLSTFYDKSKESDVISEAGEEISRIGEGIQGNLLDLTRKQQIATSRRGFAITGDPTIDRNRQNIFAQASERSEDLWEQSEDKVEDLRDKYSRNLISDIAALTDYYTNPTG